MTSTFPLRTKDSTMSSACSPVSGWEIRSSGELHADTLRIFGVKRMLGVNEGRDTAGFLCLGHHMQRERVLPEDSGPNISMMRPRGRPPIPSAASRPMEPVLYHGDLFAGRVYRRWQ